ncbi:DUF5672 family protein [Novipirellula sp. SH528]|uniref:DUF5672 family protein n=1 Tax=Novipirellula sp. SH528 TaxID=3454466 RepID=UPI003F9F1B1F
MRKVVVVVFAHSANLNALEEISLRQCWNILGEHDIRLMCPRGMDTSEYLRIAPGIEVDAIDPAWLSDVRAYNRLKISRFLYDFYQDYEYLLTYELDAFVFHDELLHWCDEGWDYIGAPLFEGYDHAKPNANPLSGGNSGFSLRKISSARKVLRTLRLIRPFSDVYEKWREHHRFKYSHLVLLAEQGIWTNTFHSRFNGCIANEDLFWSVMTEDRFPWFSVADYEVASRFSFEVNPSRLYRENNEALPFGCHKWYAYESEFWQSKIEAFRDVLPEQRKAG